MNFSFHNLPDHVTPGLPAVELPAASLPNDERIRQLEAIAQHLQSQLSDCQTAAAQAQSQLHLQVEDLTTQLTARQKLNDRQRQDIETLQEQLEQQRLAVAQERRQWEERQQNLQTDLLEAQDVVRRRADAVQRFRAELALTRTHNAELEEELSLLKRQFSAESEHWTQQRDVFEARLAGFAETEAEALQRWQEERAGLEAELAIANTERTALRAELETTQARLTTWSEQEQSAADRAVALQEQLAQSSSELEVLRSQHASLQAQAEAATAALAQHQQRDRETEQAQQQFQTLTAENLHLRREVASYVGQIERVERELGDWKQKVGKLQMHNMHLKAALERSSGDNSQSDIDDECQDYWAGDSDPPAAEAPVSEPSFVSPPTLPESGAALPRFVHRSSFG